VQRVDGARAGKPIVELRRSFSEDAFPGFDALILNLADIETIPASWQAALTATQGIYLLTCPRTREQYVGMASGSGGSSRAGETISSPATLATSRSRAVN
jgi:hypothetical protein